MEEYIKAWSKVYYYSRTKHKLLSINKKNKNKINAVETECWRRCCGITSMDMVRNDDIMARMVINTTGCIVI